MGTTQTRKLFRLVAAPAAAAGILSGALGLAAVATASTTPPPDPYAPPVFQPAQKVSPSRPQQSTVALLQQIQDFRNRYVKAPGTPNWTDGS
jgi:hypothetical protein